MKYMIKHILTKALFVCLFFSYSLLNAEITHKSGRNYIDIYINNLEPVIEKSSPDSDYYSFTFPDMAFSEYSGKEGYSTEKINFIIAVPPAGNITASLNYEEIITLGKFSPALLDSNASRGLKPYTHVKRIGSQRGVHLAKVTIQPFLYENDSQLMKIAEGIRINIETENEFPKKNIVQNPFEHSFFSHIFNQEHLAGFLESSSKTNRSSNSILEDFWYKPSRNYTKVTTTKDGIAYVKASILLENMPELQNKSTSGLHLLHKGIAYPFFAEDSDSLINSGDIYYFRGLRPAGDTTWFDNYTSKEVFYFYYDDSENPVRLTALPEVQAAQKKIESVQADIHIEKELFYSHGNFNYQIDIDPVAAEGWYWAELNPKNHPEFTYDLKLSPAGDIILRIPYQSKDFLKDAIYNHPNHKYALLVNSDTIRISTFNFLEKGTFIDTLPSSVFVPGANEIKIISLGKKDKNGNLIEIDYTLLDFIEASGSVRPFVYDSYGEYTIDSDPDNNREIEIIGFSGSEAVIIDEQNGYFKKIPAYKQGSRIQCAVKRRVSPFASLMINDSLLYTGGQPGLHIGVLRPQDFTSYEYKFFEGAGSTASEYLNSLPQGSIIAVVFNGSQLSQQAVQAFQSLGAESAGSDNAWSFAVQKGSSENKSEVNSNSDFASISEFFEHSGGKSYSIKINLPAEKNYTLKAAGYSALEEAELESVSVSDLRNPDNFAEYLIITHSEFLGQAEKIAEYRRQTHGISTMIVDVENIYKEFNFGKKSPHAIRNFLKYTFHNWQSPAPLYVLLLGDANWDTRNILSESVNKDFIPAYGWPVTDYWYSLLETENEQDFAPDLFISRLPVQKTDQCENYIHNLKEYESLPYLPWNKSFLFLSGGFDNSEIQSFSTLGYHYTEDAYHKLSNKPFCAEPERIIKQDPQSINKDAGRIKAAINSGVMWTNYLGHGSVTSLEMDGWNADRLNNKGKYGFLTTVSCNTGAFAQPDEISRNEEYIFERGKGFIASGGSSSGGDANVSTFFMIEMIENVRDTSMKLRNIAQIASTAKINFGSEKALRNLGYQFNILGEPLVELKIAKKTELFILESEIQFLNENGNDFFTENDSLLIISGNVYNAGYGTDEEFEITAKREYDGKQQSFSTELSGICRFREFEIIIPLKNMPGVHTISLTADLQNIIPEETKENNTIKKSLDIFSRGLAPLDPLPNWNVKSNPLFRFIKTEPDDSRDLFLSLYFEEEGRYILLHEAQDDEIRHHEAYFDWFPDVSLNHSKKYKLRGWLNDSQTGIKSREIEIPFHVSSLKQDSALWLQKGQEIIDFTYTKNLNYDNSEELLVISSDSVFYRLQSAGGSAAVYPGTEIEISDSTVASDALIGIKIALMSKTDSTEIKYRFYDTWGDDSSTIKLHHFLEDSVSADDYLIFTVCSAFGRQLILNEERGEGYSRLKTILDSFGSQKSDEFIENLLKWAEGSIPEGWGLSYAAVFDAGKGVLQEAVDTTGSYIVFSGNLPIYNFECEIITGNIGPAKSWDAFKLTFTTTGSSTISTVIYGSDGNSDSRSEKLKSTSSENIDLSGVNAERFPYINAQIKLKRDTYSESPSLKKLECRFSPSPELRLDTPLTDAFSEAVLRGDTLTVEISWQNISPRSTLDSTHLSYSAGSGGISQSSDTFSLKNAKPGEEKTFTLKVPTEKMDLNNSLNIILNKNSIPREQYSFNNTTEVEFSIREDTAAPEIKLYADGNLIENGSYISIRPLLKAEMYDNSRLEVLNPSNLELWVNAKVYKESNAAIYEFQSKIGMQPLKAELTVLPDSLLLSDRQHWIRVIAIDASGNTVTKDYDVFLYPEGRLTELRNYPNPFSDETTIEFNYRSPYNGGDAVIDIFNMKGKLISTIKTGITVGKNSALWNGKSKSGESLPSGFYFYRIKTEAEVYSEPAFGKLILVK